MVKIYEFVRRFLNLLVILFLLRYDCEVWEKDAYSWTARDYQTLATRYITILVFIFLYEFVVKCLLCGWNNLKPLLAQKFLTGRKINPGS